MLFTMVTLDLTYMYAFAVEGDVNLHLCTYYVGLGLGELHLVHQMASLVC